MSSAAAFPDHSSLSEPELTELRNALVESREIRSRQIEEIDEGASGLDVEAADRARAGARGIVAEIDDALARMDEGTYGWCATCLDPIPFERLQVVPHAAHCVRCS